MKKFICTNDIITANKLKTLGYTLFNHNDNQWVFLNNSHLTYTNESNLDINKIVKTDIMTF